jgi:hypothetical protein
LPLPAAEERRRRTEGPAGIAPDVWAQLPAELRAEAWSADDADGGAAAEAGGAVGRGGAGEEGAGGGAAARAGAEGAGAGAGAEAGAEAKAPWFLLMRITGGGGGGDHFEPLSTHRRPACCAEEAGVLAALGE